MNTTLVVTATLQGKFPGVTLRPSGDHPAVNVPAADAKALLQHLRDEHGYDLLSDVTAADWGADVSPRFTVFWHLFSTRENGYIRVAADCASDSEPAVDSVAALWPAANWHERETYDLLGIGFNGHPDLRRILMWDDYPYHPLRKDFPLAGIETPLPDEEVGSITRTAVKPAPVAGGPFVAKSGRMNLKLSEPSGKDESWNEALEKPVSK